MGAVVVADREYLRGGLLAERIALAEVFVNPDTHGFAIHYDAGHGTATALPGVTPFEVPHRLMKHPRDAVVRIPGRRTRSWRPTPTGAWDTDWSSNPSSSSPCSSR